MQRKAFVLLSGGIDSTVCLYKAMKDFFPIPFEGRLDYEDWVGDNKTELPCTWVEAVSIDYGQRHIRETVEAQTTCNIFGIKHTVLGVGDILKDKNIMLSAESVGNVDMVHKDYSEIQGLSPTYVPFRNGLFLSVITAHAQKYVNDQIRECTGAYEDEECTILAAKDLVAIYYGAHAEDSANWAYPDCTPEFNGAMANAIYTGSYNTIRLVTPLQWMEKHQIVQLGEDLLVDWRSTWSCYDNKPEHCGECPTCRARKQAFQKAGAKDPTVYRA
jgi:7-cyano-7-deazaguanine synthase